MMTKEPSRRHVQQRRAAIARATWPEQLATEYLFTDAEACFVDALIYLACEHGPEFAAYRVELANRAPVSTSSQVATEAKLQSFGLLEIVPDKTNKTNKGANTYRLKGVLREAARIV